MKCVGGYCARDGHEHGGPGGHCAVIPAFTCKGVGTGTCCDDWQGRFQDILDEAQNQLKSASPAVPANDVDCNGSWFSVDLRGNDGSQCSSNVGLYFAS